MKSAKKLAANEIYALAFGLFLGLCILKFGNPVILDKRILPPASFSDYWYGAWPIHWVNWFFLPLAAIGALLFVQSAGALPRRHYSPWLLVLPLVWLGWQLVSAMHSVDADLTIVTVWQFCGCVACYYLGNFLFRTPRALSFLLAGILAAFAVCLIRAIQQHIEFPRTRQFLLEGQRAGWTNLPPALLQEMRRDQTIVNTNGVDVINPAIQARFAKNRVMGTLVYPNALAGVILLLFPVSFVLAYHGTKKLKPIVHIAAAALTVGLAALAFIWSGSKFGWLIAMLMGGLYLFRLRWPMTLRILTLVVAAALGLGIFAIRFHSYFANGATSTTARFDYWRAAVQTTAANPIFGSGPGTFQRPYEKLKSPDAEMARLTHNDYLEQFSDSGLVGGVAYTAWIVTVLFYIGRNVWKSQNQTILAVFIGLLGWFIQGLGEFSLYIPALAWTAFTLLGWILARGRVDEPQPVRESNRQKPARS
jgi:O-antigen ligase